MNEGSSNNFYNTNNNFIIIFLIARAMMHEHTNMQAMPDTG